MREPLGIYERREQAFECLGRKQKRTADRLGNYRLTAFILGAAASYLLYRSYSTWLGLAMGALTLAVFVMLALQHTQVRAKLKYAEVLSGLNRRGVERLSGQCVTFEDTGTEFKSEEHLYSSDLDLFGQASAFQWITSAHTPLGRATLAELLKQPPQDRSAIIARQEAVVELAGDLAWRQRFEAEAMLISNELRPTEPLLQWARETHPAYLQPAVRLGIRLLPVITIIAVALYVLHFPVAWQIPGLLVVIQFLLLWARGKERSRILSTVYHYEASLRTYTKMLRQIEGRSFRSRWLQERQRRLRDLHSRSAFEQIGRLAKIVDRISNRENALFFAINVLTLWDYQCMIALEEWKKGSGKLLKAWLEVLAELEAVASLANIRFEHPDWAVPVIVAEDDPLQRGPSGLAAQNMGHPLITRERVCNDFEMKASAPVTVITGSNMSGKSTFLRTVGVNLVLAYAGAPVCAEQFSCSLLDLWTCMRVSDNLEQSISSFYAEILRIKRIVEAAKTGRRVCFLLDEIFKGTNSYDRHQGAKALINQLRKDGALGLISTHDLELGDLERESHGRVKNYHFREYYQDGEIRFDYKLRRGISTTRNALYLIKMAGIELDDKQ